MKNIIYLCLIISILIFNTKAANAYTILGSEARWRNLGNDTFEVTIISYKNCTDYVTNFFLPPPVITSDSCANTFTLNLIALDSNSVDLTPVCKTQQSPCAMSGGSGTSSSAIPLGIIKVTWRYKMYLGAQYANCCWYKIRWQFCCRSSNITSGAADAVFTNDAWLNRCIQNNSPIFTNDPMVMRCPGQDVAYNNGAIDTENDSISYRLAPLLSGSYASPWSYSYPFTCYGGNNPNPNLSPPFGFNLNPTNGDLLFRPTSAEISVIKIEALEWRKINGVTKIIGRTSREIQYNDLQNCNNKLPTVSGPFVYEACAGKQLCITINTNDQDTNDTTQLSSNALIAIPGSTWNVAEDTVKYAIGTFCWTPSDSQISTLPYYFNAIVNDKHCPLKGVNSRAFTIIVKPSPNYSTTITHISGNQWKFEATPIGTFANAKYQWYVPKLIGAGLPNQVLDSSQIAYCNFTKDGKYIIRSKMYNNTSCFTEKYDTIDVYCATPLELISTNDSTICLGNSISISTTSITGSAPFTYKWYANGVLIDTAQTITVSPVLNTSYRVIVISNDTCLFTNTDTINILVDTSTLVLQPISDKRICRGTQITITPIITGSQLHSFYRWYFNGLIINASKTLVHSPQVSGVYVFEVQSAGNCSVNLRDTFNVFVDTNVISLNSMNDTLACKGAAVSLTPNIKNGTSPYRYQWYSNGVLIDTLSSIIRIVNTTQQYQVRVISSDSCHSVAYDTVMIIADTSRLVMQTLNDTSICEGSITQIIPSVLKGTTPIQYSWYENNTLISNNDTLKIIPTKASRYILKSVSSDDCYNTVYDTVDVNFFPKTLVVKHQNDTSICPGTSITLTSFVSGGNSYNYSWCPVGKSCSTLPNPVYTFDTTTKVYLEITSNAICTEIYRDTITINVFPKSPLTINTKNQTINKNQSTIIKAGNGNGFVWSGNSIIQNWGDSIEVNPMLTNTYKVIGKNIYGCTDFAQITITVTHVGIDNKNAENSKLNIHPNPAKDAITISGYQWQIQRLYEIDNILGQQVLRGEINSNSTLIDIHTLPAGIYFIKVGNEVKKWIKE